MTASDKDIESIEPIPQMAAPVMLRDLPMGVWLHLSSGNLLRSFEAQLLSDDAFVTRVKARLAAPSGKRLEGVESAANTRLHGTAASAARTRSSLANRLTTP